MSRDSKSWWDRALGRTAQPSPPQPQAYQPPQQGYPPQQQYPQPQYQPQQGYPPQGYQPQQGYPPPQSQMVISTPSEAVAAMGQWQGGEAMRTETQSCPQCGGFHFYSRSQGARRGPPPAPLCFDCGYNAMFDQGDPSVYGAGTAV